MVFSFFKKKDSNSQTVLEAASDASSAEQEIHPATASLLRTIAEAKKNNPMIGITIGADEINNKLFAAFSTEGRVHTESLLMALSALAGFSCQMSVRELAAAQGLKNTDDCFIEVKTNDGKRYFFGDALNKPLAEDSFSVCSIITGGITSAGGADPDLNEIFKYVSTILGTKSFGKPRVPKEHSETMDTPENFVKNLWDATLPTIDLFCDSPSERPILLAVCIQKIIIQAKKVISPNIAGTLCLETAIAMSKIDPASVNIKI